MSQLHSQSDIVLIGAGIMSGTLGTLLKALMPEKSITIYTCLLICCLSLFPPDIWKKKWCKAKKKITFDAVLKNDFLKMLCFLLRHRMVIAHVTYYMSVRNISPFIYTTEIFPFVHQRLQRNYIKIFFCLDIDFGNLILF